jgi:hypothetical protein
MVFRVKQDLSSDTPQHHSESALRITPREKNQKYAMVGGSHSLEQRNSKIPWRSR